MRPSVARRPLLRYALLLLTAAAPTAFAADKTYEVRMTRPDAVGDKFRVVGEGAVLRQTVVIVDGDRKEQPPSGSGIKLEGTAEVLAITPGGKASKLSVAVDRCIRVSGPEEAELLAKGSVVVAEAEGKDTKFSLKGGELPAEASEVLELLFHLSADDSRSTDDELFGTDAKQKVGASWPMRADRAVKDFAAENVRVDPADISGEVKLEAVVRVDGAERLKLAGRMTVKKLEPRADAAGTLPVEIKPEAGSMDFKFDVSVPADTASKSGDESISARHRMTYTGAVPGGQTIRTEVTMQRAAQMKRTELK